MCLTCILLCGSIRVPTRLYQVKTNHYNAIAGGYREKVRKDSCRCVVTAVLKLSTGPALKAKCNCFMSPSSPDLCCDAQTCCENTVRRDWAVFMLCVSPRSNVDVNHLDNDRAHTEGDWVALIYYHRSSQHRSLMSRRKCFSLVFALGFASKGSQSDFA